MPCNAVAQQTAKAAISTSLLLDNPVAIEALARQLRIAFGGPVRVGGDNWIDAFRQHAEPQAPFASLTGQAGLFFGSEAATLEVRRTGEIVLRQGWYAYKHRMPADQLQAAMAELVNMVNGLLFQGQVRQLVGQQERIVSEQRASNGALVLHVEL